jgi:ABC-type lipoprotein release transport system permease subunit
VINVTSERIFEIATMPESKKLKEVAMLKTIGGREFN